MGWKRPVGAKPSAIDRCQRRAGVSISNRSRLRWRSELPALVANGRALPRHRHRRQEVGSGCEVAEGERVQGGALRMAKTFGDRGLREARSETLAAFPAVARVHAEHLVAWALHGTFCRLVREAGLRARPDPRYC